MKELTPWYPGEIKPVHIGVYERKVNDFSSYSFWNGTDWMSWQSSPADAYLTTPYKSGTQYLPWRGFTCEQK